MTLQPTGDRTPGSPAAFDPVAAFAAQFAAPEHSTFTLDAGAGSPGVVLVHGFPGTPAEMRPLAQLFHAAGYTAHAPLLPGFGRDIPTLHTRTHEDWLSAVCTAFTTVHDGHRPTLLLGHSLGGALAIAAAARLQPDGLIALAPFHTLDHPLWKTLPVTRRLFPTVKPFRVIPFNLDDPETRRAVEGFMPGVNWDDPAQRAAIRAGVRDFRLPVAMFDEIRKAGEAAYRLAPDVRVRSLVVQGEGDTLVTPAATAHLVARFGVSPEYRVIPGDHNLPLEDHPGWPGVRDAVTAFAAAAQATR
jgi:carboxylesterase